jgi:hypothetical protein
MAKPKNLSVKEQAALSLYWFATNAHWIAILITLLPLQAKLSWGCWRWLLFPARSPH